MHKLEYLAMSPAHKMGWALGLGAGSSHVPRSYHALQRIRIFNENLVFQVL
jgi:hypothetical protein